MKYRFPLACLLLFLAAGCQPPEQAAPEPAADLDALADKAREAYEAAEDFDGKLAVFRGFYDEHGVHDVVLHGMGQLVHDAGKADRGADVEPLLLDVLAKVEDPEKRLRLELQRATLYAGAGRAGDLAALVEELDAEHELRFGARYKLMHHAARAGAWETLLGQAEATLPMASKEAFMAEHPDLELSEEELARKGRNRIAIVHAFKGWALANLDRGDEAFATFEAAADQANFNMLGVDDTPLQRYWGMALLRQGQAQEAMEKLTAEAIYSPRHEALDAYREAYAAFHGSEEGFDEHLAGVRRRHGKKLEDFTLADYEGREVRYSSFQGDVVLLAFWFPT